MICLLQSSMIAWSGLFGGRFSFNACMARILTPNILIATSMRWNQSFVSAEDIFEELDKYGEIENLNICDNLADHMVGSVYAKFKDENDAAKAMQVRPCLCHPHQSNTILQKYLTLLLYY